MVQQAEGEVPQVARQRDLVEKVGDGQQPLLQPAKDRSVYQEGIILSVPQSFDDLVSVQLITYDGQVNN